jgi:hypothetical protein
MGDEILCGDQDHNPAPTRSLLVLGFHQKILNSSRPLTMRLSTYMQTTAHIIRSLVEQALYFKQLTPDIENAINTELSRLGYISDVDYEALELLMSEMDAGRIRLVPSP